ncbi:lipopolysaccharide assembly protein LapB [Micromonospora sp. HM5-17]|jgi:tetratricopeptide (TPR) repeat protein|uniref:tetratricopeptide repeat protein n=1 Tax=Micromonospora sp. HM5-17 TaxID=2487710 RepID=UPI000F475A88|nr:tetratricopeptide repeat protein [Micromonospora sp. HM5-17]ROT32694.1 tetratricopeptide repeat protein [Micromonospora sp. HM5-17]
MTVETAGTAGGIDNDPERAARTKLVERALHLAEIGRVPEAYPLLAEALRTNPEDPFVQLAIAHCYQLQGRWSNMLTMVDLAVRRAPMDPQVHRKRSVALRELGRIPEAVAAAEQARTLDPDDARNEIVRAEALLRQTGTRAVLAALAATTRARELDPQSVWAHLTEASVQRRMAEFGRARAAYREALRLAPDNPTALHGLATLDSMRGRAVRADPALGGMLQVAPTDPAALRAATRGARQVLWLLTDLGCLLLLLAAVVVGIAQSLPTRLVAAAVGLGVTGAATLGVLVLLWWRMRRLSAPIRTLIRTNLRRPTFVAAPLRLVALVLAMLLMNLGPNPPEVVEIVGPVLVATPMLTLLVRWRTRALRELGWFLRRWWFRLAAMRSGVSVGTGSG